MTVFFSDMLPSICSGVVAKVVKAKKVVPHLSTSHVDSTGDVPVMLETTASVHPGGSGGAIVNSSGHMIGLVTRYELIPRNVDQATFSCIWLVFWMLFGWKHPSVCAGMDAQILNRWMSGCSNAKHGGGTVIPHMNFSIPSAALEPVFKFAKGELDNHIKTKY